MSDAAAETAAVQGDGRVDCGYGAVGGSGGLCGGFVAAGAGWGRLRLEVVDVLFSRDKNDVSPLFGGLIDDEVK